MDAEVVIFWFVCLVCASGLVAIFKRLPHAGRGWLGVYLAILLVAVAGKISRQTFLIYAAGVLWVLLVLVPALLGKLYHRSLLRRDYGTTYRVVQIISWLHPLDGWRSQPEIIRAIKLAQRGETAAASDILERYRNVASPAAMGAIANLYRITQRWEEFLVWSAQHQLASGVYPQFLSAELRARGEVGDPQFDRAIRPAPGTDPQALTRRFTRSIPTDAIHLLWPASGSGTTLRGKSCGSACRRAGLLAGHSRPCGGRG